MAATIIQFPQTHSNIFLNLTQLINLASDNQVVEAVSYTHLTLPTS